MCGKYLKLIPNIEILYERDYDEERGDLLIFLKNGSWSIDYNFKTLAYYRGISSINIYLDITDEPLKTFWKKDEATGKRVVDRVVEWLIDNYGTEFNIVTHNESEAEIAEELSGKKLTKQIYKPKLILEYYENNKIFKSPFFNDEIRIYIENENLEYIRNNKKIIKAFPLNKEIHFYGIKPTIRKYITIFEGGKPKRTELVSIID